MTVDVIIPTYNPGEELQLLLESLLHQTIKPNKIFIMNTYTDSCNVDIFNATYKIADNIEIRHLESKSFDHATTRNDGARLSDADYLVFFTQDAIPANQELIERLMTNHSENVVVSYGRQVGNKENNEIEYLSRMFNYPPTSFIKSEKDKEKMGIKLLFCSNVCAMYNRKVFWELNGFDDHNIFNEDMLFAYKVIKSGYSIAYEADALVKHSHDYSYKKIFNRYFDQGVSQKANEEQFKGFSSIAEGKKQAKYILNSLWDEHEVGKIMRFLLESSAKVSGYFLGKHYNWIPDSICKYFSLNKNYFNNNKN